MTDLTDLAEQIVLDRMEYYGYPPGIARNAAAKMAVGAETGEYHRRFGCEPTEHGWECTPATPPHPDTQIGRR